MVKLSEFLLHICVVCSFVCIIAKVLDWFNPYMDFSGHIWFAQAALYLAVIVLAVMGSRIYPEQEGKRKPRAPQGKRKHARR